MKDEHQKALTNHVEFRSNIALQKEYGQREQSKELQTPVDVHNTNHAEHPKQAKVA